MKSVTYESLREYDKIIIYGAGTVGSKLLHVLRNYGFDNSKVTVWDAGSNVLSLKLGFTVEQPNFNGLIYNEKTIIIIALSKRNNMKVIEEIKEKFLKLNFKNIVISSDIIKETNVYNITEYVNDAYGDCEYEDDINFSDFKTPVKLIAFYLPQYHEIPENNSWWGNGFTEWTNTKKAKPHFKGHYQPREPHSDFGYYDLSNADVIRKQAELAKRHGIYGWCMYYYWFSGKKLLTKPIDILLDNKDIDIGFCLCWCNEAWTKSWVGNDEEVLIDCKYQKDDPERFIDDIKKYFDDSRYIKKDGAPVILVYRAQNIPDVKDTFKRWRKRAQEVGVGEIHIMSTIQPYFVEDMNLQHYFDSETDLFSPTRFYPESFRLVDNNNTVISNQIHNYNSCVYDYIKSLEKPGHKQYLSCFCGYDTSPRNELNYRIYDLSFSLLLFYNLVRFIIKDAITNSKEFIFIFAWNEWAEGAYLEPDKRFGYTMINTLSRAIYNLPFK